MGRRVLWAEVKCPNVILAQLGGGLDNGPQRCANLVQLYERARQFGTFSRQGLYRFNQFLASLDEETDPTQAAELAERLLVQARQLGTEHRALPLAQTVI